MTDLRGRYEDLAYQLAVLRDSQLTPAELRAWFDARAEWDHARSGSS